MRHFYPKNFSRNGKDLEAYCFTENKLFIFTAEDVRAGIFVVKYENITSVELLYNLGYNPLELAFKLKNNTSYKLYEQEDSI